MQTFSVPTSPAYSLHLAAGLWKSQALLQELRRRPKWFIISERDLLHLFQPYIDFWQAAKIEIEVLSFAGGESKKDRDTKVALEDQLFAAGMRRDMGLIAMGGGVVLDLVGFIAATYMRGVAVIYAPTTLLAMVDAAIGGKTGINTAYGKNMLGCIKQPQSVWMELDMLKTLPELAWQQGWIEMFKHGCLADLQYAQQLAACLPHQSKFKRNIQELIYKSLGIKAAVVVQDLQDHGLRQALNFGHTVAHALEAHSDFQLSHGEAVAIGMVEEARQAAMTKDILAADALWIKEVIQQAQLPTQLSRGFAAADLQKWIVRDKKNSGSGFGWKPQGPLGEWLQLTSLLIS
jgi:3-dehydroquinate synthase